MGSASKYELPFKLNNPNLLHNQSFIGGEWKGSKSGNEFDVVDPGTGKPWISCPTNDASDVDAAVQSSHECFLQYKKISPRERAQMLFKWDQLIRENKEDIATILVLRRASRAPRPTAKSTTRPASRGGLPARLSASRDPSLRLRCQTAASSPSSSPWVSRPRWCHGTSPLP